MAAVVAYLALMGGVRAVLGGGVTLVIFLIVALALSSTLWWLTAWVMLMGQVRMRALFCSGLITGIAMFSFALSATVWMPNNVTSNQRQFGFFGVALSLVTWFSGAAVCIMVGACAAPVLAEDTGSVGRFARLGADSLLVEGAPASLPPPTHSPRLVDAFTPPDEEIPHATEMARPDPNGLFDARPGTGDAGGT